MQSRCKWKSRDVKYKFSQDVSTRQFDKARTKTSWWPSSVKKTLINTLVSSLGKNRTIWDNICLDYTQKVFLLYTTDQAPTPYLVEIMSHYSLKYYLVTLRNNTNSSHICHISAVPTIQIQTNNLHLFQFSSSIVMLYYNTIYSCQHTMTIYSFVEIKDVSICLRMDEGL